MLIADQSFILIYFDIASSYGWGSTASRLVPLWWVSLLFTTKFPAIPSICSFYQPQKDERLSWPWNHPMVLNMQPLDWKSTTLTTRPFLHNYKIIQSAQKKALCTGELLRVQNIHWKACNCTNQWCIQSFLGRPAYISKICASRCSKNKLPLPVYSYMSL